MTIPLDQNPESILPADILNTIQKNKTWRVAHTKSRREKALAHYFTKAGIGYYLPMFKRQQSNIKRVRYSLIPVFNGYLFFQADDFEKHKAMRSNHIARIIDVGNEKALVKELKQIEQALSGSKKIYPYDFVDTGKWVRVKKGPLKGIEGQIVRKEKNYRLVLSVESIKQSICVSIESAQVEPISKT
jgi:transcription antitermination factor NusG